MSSWEESLFRFSFLRKKSLCWAHHTQKLDVVHTLYCLSVLPDRLQSTMTSLVLLLLSTRLLSKHHCVSYWTLLHFGLNCAKDIVCTNQKSFGSFRFSFGKRSHVAMSFLKRKGFLLATQRNNTILFKTIFQLEKTLFYNSYFFARILAPVTCYLRYF